MVYILLGGLVLAVGGMSRFANWLSPQTPTPAGLPVPAGADAGLAAAAAAAIHAYRTRAGRGGR